MLTPSGGAVGRAFHSPRDLHSCIHRCWNCRLSHLVRHLGLRLRGNRRLCRSWWRWLNARGRLRLSVCSGHKQLRAVRWWLTGLWVSSRTGVIIRDVHGEFRFAGHQHPLDESGEALSRTIPGQLLTCGGVKSSSVERAEAVVRVVRVIR